MEAKHRDPNQIYVSTGNRKNGNIPSFSIMPGKDCRPGVPCFNNGCYANGMTTYDNIKKSWHFNSEIVRNDIQLFKVQIIHWLNKNRPEYFRLHVGGDFFSEEYLIAWMNIIEEFKETKFSVYTKRFDFRLVKLIPELPNLKLFLSVWHKKEDLKPTKEQYQRFPCAVTLPKGTPPSTRGYLCPGSCIDCKFCYEDNSGRDVYFYKKRYGVARRNSK